MDFGVFLVGGGDLGWGQVLLETWGKLAALPFFFPSLESSTSGVGGERKAQLILFIDEAN